MAFEEMEIRKANGLDFAELEAQGVELLPDRVEMTRRRVQRAQNIAIVTQINIAAGNTVGGDLTQINASNVEQSIQQDMGQGGNE